MIRPFTCLCLLLAAGSGLYLYQSKHQAQLLDREINRTMQAADAARQRSGLLRAEYALLNDPARLADLSHDLLPTLQTTSPGQFSTFADLDRRLPAVGAPPPAEPPPLEPEDPTAKLPQPEPPKFEAAKPEPPKVEVARAEPAQPEARADPIRLPVVAPPAALASARVSAAPAAPTRPQPAAPRAAPPPAPAQPVAAPPATAREAIARIARGGPVDPAVPMVASALGMARAMMTVPTPVSTAYAAVPPVVGGR
jgi:hypothetical protein